MVLAGVAAVLVVGLVVLGSVTRGPGNEMAATSEPDAPSADVVDPVEGVGATGPVVGDPAGSVGSGAGRSGRPVADGSTSTGGRVAQPGAAGLDATVPATTTTAPSPKATAGCQLEGSIVSAGSGGPVTFQVTNARPDALRLYWIDYEGRRRWYATIDSGSTFRQPTYAGHPWVVTPVDSRACLRLVADPAVEHRISVG
jgi:hypothetical protein